VKLDPLLLEILVCPDCKGSLTVDQDHDELICNGCGLIYPVRDDIPIMLVDEARRPTTLGRADEPDDLSSSAATPPSASSGTASAVADDAGDTAG
jgi:uncharacterized protein YbaR (Trm112 family)